MVGLEIWNKENPPGNLVGGMISIKSNFQYNII